MRMNMKMERTAHGRTLNYEGFMRIMLMAFAVGMAGGAFAYNWTGDAGNLLLDDRGNWQSESTQTDRFVVTNKPGGALSVGGDGTFFNGGMLRYSGSFTVTNDFGAGKSLTDVGQGKGSALHIESGATLVQKSGGICGITSSMVSDSSTFVLDGADAWFEGKSVFALRSTASRDWVVQPKLIVTNGASFVATTIYPGKERDNSASYMCVAGEGSLIGAGEIRMGYNSESPTLPVTNLVEVLDYATITAKTFYVGSSSSRSVLNIDKGFMRVSSSLNVGSTAAASNCWMRISSGGVVTNYGSTVVGSAPAEGITRVSVTGNGSSFVGLGTATLSNARVEAQGTGARFQVDGDTTVSGAKSVSISATDGASVTVKKMYVANAIVDGNLNYSQIFMNTSGGELVLTNATVTGTRIEMPKSSTIRILDTHLTLTSNHFMMGDGDGSNADNNALRRDVYVGGADTWIKLLDGEGLTVRGSNTTVHVEIPAEGFSTSHPVFDIKKIGFQSISHRLRIEVTAESSKMNKGVRYTLFRCSTGNSCQSSQIDWIYDPNVIKIDKSVSGEVGVIVKDPGLKIFVR